MKKKFRSVSIHRKRIGWLGLVLLGLLVACSTGESSVESTAVPPGTAVIDEATGLELNPAVVPVGEFVVLGTITAVNLIPQDAPLIKVVTTSGQNYQILTQPVAQIMYEDGTAVQPLDIKNGLRIRATVQHNETGGLGGEPVLSSKDFTILPPKNE
jgi:hypothetical protein